MLRNALARAVRKALGSADGQALILFALGLAGFAGLVAMSVDVGNLLYQRRATQGAADAAALAGVGAIIAGGNSAAAIAEARNYAAKNDGGGTGSAVTVNVPPASGPSAGNANAVEVIITRPVPKYFLQVVYSGQWQVTSRSVAKVNSTVAGFGVLTLDPSACNSLLVDSNAKLQVTGGGVYVNSNCNQALKADSNATISGDIISVVGGWTGDANVHVSPTPKTGQKPIPDPFKDVPTPPKTGTKIMGAGPNSTCKYTTGGNYTFNPGLYDCKMLFDSNTRATFNPGNYVFTGGFEASSNSTITFGHGIYVFEGFGLKFDSNTKLDGTAGVLLYNTCAAASCPTTGNIVITSNSALNIKPYGAPYLNLTIWQDRSSHTPIVFDSNSSTAPSGAIYAPAAFLKYDSNCTVPLQFVVGTAELDSNAKVNVDVHGQTTIGTMNSALSE